MFSVESALKVEVCEIEYDSLFAPLMEVIANNNSLNSAFLMSMSDQLSNDNVICSYNMNCKPLFGSKFEDFKAYLQERFSKVPTPHCHKLSPEMFKVFSQLVEDGEIAYKACYLPAVGVSTQYLFIGVFRPKQEDFKIEELNTDVLDLLSYVDNIKESEALKIRLEVLENYVKEIGHDIASSVQATIAKLRNMSRGLYDEPQMKTKAKEAEAEIMGTFRVAEQLGIAVDPEYNIQNGGDFRILDSINTVRDHLQSEANERHIDINLKLPSNCSSLSIWGDQKAIESAISQLLHNAIKYGFGSNPIEIALDDFKNNISVKITNKGIPINKEEISRLWDFGFRGKNALDKHVNGAGIGLFTVKKIVAAHGGEVFLRISTSNAQYNSFGFNIPKRDLLSKIKLL
ncbi:sensor histidine kinase [Geomonas terrae]|uniref:histidine kinase n=1 Tax=Geomonas terrae TaxID=2562681 RepID=A0A4S1CCB8_9BACT|nr:sensor histidine kinase [Geomonas terrae]TGU71035.1 sensor histidine kinase [Geomonas terrae]